MDTAIAGIMACVGAFAGWALPSFGKRMMTKKLEARGRQYTEDFWDRVPAKILLTLFNGALWGLAGYYGEQLFQAICIALLCTMAMAFGMIDKKIHIIPNEMVLAMIPVGLLYQAIQYGWKGVLTALICIVALGATFLILGMIMGLEKIGAGDVKLAGAMAGVLGYPMIIYGLGVMAIALAVYSIGGIVAGKLTHVSMIPFAPFLMIGQIAGLMLMVLPVALPI